MFFKVFFKFSHEFMRKIQQIKQTANKLYKINEQPVNVKKNLENFQKFV